jgi:hypothetical protein
MANSLLGWINGIFSPINEFNSPYQSKNNGIPAGPENRKIGRPPARSITPPDRLGLSSASPE